MPSEDATWVNNTADKINALPDLSVPQREALFYVAVWEKNPTLQGRMPKALGLTREMVLKSIDIIGDNPMLEEAYTQIRYGKETAEGPTLITQVREMGAGVRNRRSFAEAIGANLKTVYKYSSLLAQGGRVPRLRDTNNPRPETLEVQLFVDVSIRNAAAAGRKISNLELAALATKHLDREITISMIKDAVFRASLTGNFPRRGAERTKTWSTSQEAGRATKERVRAALRKHMQQHGKETPIALATLVDNLQIGYKQISWLYKKIAKEEKLPPTIRRKHPKFFIPAEEIEKLKKRLIQEVSRQREENPNGPISINRLAKELKRSRGLAKKLYDEEFG